MIFVKEMQLKKLRGVLCKKGKMRCLPWPMVAGHGRERKREALMGKGVEFVGILDILGEKIFWEFGGRKEGKKKEKGKRKRNYKMKIFS